MLNTRTSFIVRILQNVAFWLLLSMFVYLGRRGNYHFYPILLGILFCSFGIPAYINNFVLIPRFLLKRRYMAYLAVFAVLVLIFAVVSYYLTTWANHFFLGLNYMGMIIGMPACGHMYPVLAICVLFAFAKFVSDAFLNQRKLEMMEHNQLKSELEILKAQTNPHFLFNSLNTIFGLARRKDEVTANAVMKLSEILRYVLYDCNGSSISLEKEISFLKHYIDFAKLRKNDCAEIIFYAEAEGQEQHIAPLILLPFVENAVKHGLGGHIENAWVKIMLSVKDHILYFECANNNKNGYDQALYPFSGGVGLRNVKRRLNLLYPNKHALQISAGEDQFSVNLQLSLI